METSSRFILEKESISLLSPCSRFQKFPKDINERRAIIYLELRKAGCKKKPAIKFTSKTHCKTDTTRSRDGPLGFEVLKVKPPPNPVAVHGWSDEPAHFDLGPKRYLTTEDFLYKDAQSKYFEEQFGKQEQKIKEDYKKKLAALRDYFEEINSKCNFTHLTKEDLYNKLKRENIELKKDKKPKNLDLLTLHSLGPMIPEGRNTGGLNAVESYGIPQNPDNSPMSAVKMSFQQRYLTSKPTLEISPRCSEEMKAISPGLSEGRKGAGKDYGSGNGKILETFKSMEESELEDENYSRCKVYDELENQTRMLYEMTNEDPREFSSDYLGEKLNARKSKLNASTSKVLSTFNRIEDENEIRKKVLKNDDLINEFNKINYFYMHHEDAEESDPSSPVRKLKANEQSKHRKQQQIQEQDLFEKILEFQNQKNSEVPNTIDSTNLEKLIAKKEAVKKGYIKKIGQRPFLRIDMASALPDLSSSRFYTARSGRNSQYPSTSATTRSIYTRKGNDTKKDEIYDVKQSPAPSGRVLKSSIANLRIIVHKDQEGAKTHRITKSVLGTESSSQMKTAR